MNLNKLYSANRSNKSKDSSNKVDRTEFQRDFDRIIFSSSFRRLQNKTQVFPLPGSSVFVHNRLTHSLEVASVGRSLGSLIGEFIINKYEKELTEESKEFYKYSLYNVISSACLCHDIGNPAFGHSGEDAIASFFIENEEKLSKFFSENEWNDFVNFEGNANAIRILTQQMNGKGEGSFKLTYSTLSSIAKYPCESIAKNKKKLHRKKFGFFQSEKKIFQEIAKNTSMIIESKNPIIYKRHPFVWLVETSDDICYNIIDLEDAHRLRIISTAESIELLMNLIIEINPKEKEKVNSILNSIEDKNEKIAYLRAKSIQTLVLESTKVFQENNEKIFLGRFDNSIFDEISDNYKTLKEIQKFTISNIYNYRSVVEIENAGYNVMYELLNHFIFPMLKEDRSNSDKKALELIPRQFINQGTDYNKVLGIVDYISGMTDNYATDLYRKIKGIDMGMVI